MYYRALKTATSLAYFSLIILTWRFFAGELYWHIGFAAGVISACWLVLTYLQMNHLFRTYFDVLSRLEVIIPFWTGLALSAVTWHSAIYSEVKALALAEIVLWIWLYIMYRQNRKLYIVQGHGPVPAHTWVSPPASVLKPGDLILTSGQVANNLHESVGHAEMVLQMADGSMKAFSSYMTKGLVLNPLNDVASAVLRHGHYIVLRPTTPFTAEQIEKSAVIAIDMQTENYLWRDHVNRNVAIVVDALPLPQSWKQSIKKCFHFTGYDYIGLFMGRLTKDHWTCIAACLELYERLGIKTKPYGTGLLGLGSTIFDPIMPVRFLDDPSFRLLSSQDKAQTQVTEVS